MKKKVIIAIISIVVIIGIGFLIFSITKKEENSTKDNQMTEQEQEYYTKMYNRMYAYYKIMFNNYVLEQDKKYTTLTLTLGDLERYGFPIDDFKTYDGKEDCDRAHSFAIRKVVNNKFELNVYIKCGKDANYDYTKSYVQ